MSEHEPVQSWKHGRLAGEIREELAREKVEEEEWCKKLEEEWKNTEPEGPPGWATYSLLIDVVFGNRTGPDEEALCAVQDDLPFIARDWAERIALLGVAWSKFPTLNALERISIPTGRHTSGYKAARRLLQAAADGVTASDIAQEIEGMRTALENADAPSVYAPPRGFDWQMWRFFEILYQEYKIEWLPPNEAVDDLDLTEYIGAKDCIAAWNDVFQDYKPLQKFLAEHPHIRTVRSNPQRLYLHIVDAWNLVRVVRTQRREST